MYLALFMLVLLSVCAKRLASVFQCVVHAIGRFTMAIDDPVNSPAHYTQGEMEVITAIEGLGLDYHQGNVLKYVARYRYKNGLEDLRKAKWYIDRLIYIEEQRAIQTQRSWV
jgi:hypothetical protein